jgi:23S rRNA (guanosine2251-2'-O)-methyltransferase
MKKPQRPRDNWQDRFESGRYWMFGIHAVRAALQNPNRTKHRLVVTLNARNQLAEAIAESGITPEQCDARKFSAPLDPNSVHQGAALETDGLDWGTPTEVCAAEEGAVVLVLDRVSDPHNVGAILRTAEVFGARAVIAPFRHSAPETGALAKAASGALERQPYLRVRNIATEMDALQESGYIMVGLDGEAPISLGDAMAAAKGSPVGIVLGAEGPGLREKTRETCDALAAIPSQSGFASLNVSNAAAVALYASRT